MNLSRFNFDIKKKWLILGAIGFVLVFLLITFLISYYNYKTGGPLTEEPVSTYDEESFKRLHEELIKDKPETKESKELLEEIVEENNRKGQVVSTTANRDEIYSKEHFDTLAVNCSVLLEKYKELVVAYHELKSQCEGQTPKSAKAKPGSQTPQTAAKRSSGTPQSPSAGGFDYTRYIRSGSNNELLNDSDGSTGFNNTQLTWITLTLSQQQRIYDQSIVVFDVAEVFDLDGLTVPHLSKVEGTAQVSRGRGRIYINFTKIYTHDQTLNIEGEVYSLDRSRGINIFLQGESSLAEGFKREATDLVGLIDPSRTGVGRNVLQDTDVGREVYGSLEAGTMVLAKIRKR